ncbi:hypothetical protein BUALT_Bualt13G0124600 [Buddleja alternifolia]|uniref:Uncharacterized protein n=1 Tax=Buddleja alternifolia TaxID=168488 RepID=A0AAV6WMS0_9LAMI|nr:hypothetical protein BUALT_Bualt13G0124600 [Buddleja alternifolia]
MLFSVLKVVIPEDTMSLLNGHFPWLPEFVPKIGVKNIKNEYFKFFERSTTNHLSGNSSIVEYKSNLRLQKRQELAMASTCCRQGLVQVVAYVDKLIQHANLDIHNTHHSFSREDKILANGILNTCVVEVQDMLTTFMNLITNEWQYTQHVDMFGRESPSAKDAFKVVETGRAMQRLNSALEACLVVGPESNYVLGKLLKVVFQVPALKYPDFAVRQFLGKGLKSFKYNYDEEEYQLFANVLTTHFKHR